MLILGLFLARFWLFWLGLARFGWLRSLLYAKNWLWNKKFVYVLSYLNIFKAESENNPWTHSPQQNKKAVLVAAACFKAFALVRSQRQ